MYDRILYTLDKSNPNFDFVRDGTRMEIWVRGKEWFPILISKIGADRYRIVWGDIIYRDLTMDNGLKRVLRICQTIHSHC